MARPNNFKFGELATLRRRIRALAADVSIIPLLSDEEVTEQQMLALKEWCDMFQSDWKQDLDARGAGGAQKLSKAWRIYQGLESRELVEEAMTRCGMRLHQR